jgi:2-keto-4-pentenoate hydratase/2-oxohepta-3-ene-1,7-dioic acid hydratase in catechol pathway
MKIIRYQSKSGQIGYAAEQPEGAPKQIEGDIYGKFSVTDRRAEVQKLLSPVVPTTIFCIGLNYRKHAEETKAKIPEFPVLFMKSPSAIQHPDDPIVLPKHLKSDQVDYECELAVVIGGRARTSARPTH